MRGCRLRIPNRKLVKDQAAEADLIGIWLYTFETWRETQADRYLGGLEEGIRRLAADPTTGVPRAELREGYWSKKLEHHIVFYTFTADEGRIRRVLHEVMDVVATCRVSGPMSQWQGARNLPHGSPWDDCAVRITPCGADASFAEYMDNHDIRLDLSVFRGYDPVGQ